MKPDMLRDDGSRGEEGGARTLDRHGSAVTRGDLVWEGEDVEPGRF